jgi:LuxR family transcriptional regulator, quorum-sensing system regulator CciR
MGTREAVRLRRAYQTLTATTELLSAAREIKIIGEVLECSHPAVVDDYTQRRLLPAEDGRALSELFGWEQDFQDDWVEHGLHRVSPIGAVCRRATRPFSWDAARMTLLAKATAGRSAGAWHLTPERGIYGGISVPVHLPGCGTGSVTWVTRDPHLNLEARLSEHEDLLRLAAYRFMDIVYAGREDAGDSPSAAPLSERELECLTWAALGRTDGEIAALLNRSPTTVRFHVENAMRKLGARNRVQAVAIACQLGLIHADPPTAS